MNPQRIQNLPWREVDGRAVLIQVSSGEVHELNPVATLLWTLADGCHTVEEMTNQVCQHFDIHPEKAKDDTEGFLSCLADRNLLQWVQPATEKS